MTTTDFHLAGPFAPVQDETTAYDLPVDGAIPTALDGRYLRNGPNPRRPTPATGSSARECCTAWG